MEEIFISDFFSASDAYFIAINQYRSPAIEDLLCPAHDVSVLKNVLETNHGFIIDPVKFPNEQGEEIVLNNPLIDADADQVKDILCNIKTNKKERMFIYFTGHSIAS